MIVEHERSTITAKTLTFRPHQRTTIDGIRIAWLQGIANVLAVVATGGGKTHIFLGLIDEILKDEPHARFLIIAHRKELIEQPAERIAQFWPHRLMDVGIVMADQNEPDRRITIATVQTLQSAQRLAGILACGPIDYLIIDECHHANAQSYLNIIETLRAANPDLRHLGVTATPLRSDDGGLPYDKKVAHYGVKELVREGYLAPPRWLAIQTGISLAQVPMVYGGANGADFNQRQLVNVFETDNCFDLVVESHRKYADGRKALAFVGSVEGAYRLADTFTRSGIPAAAADGTTDKDARRAILADFRNERYEVLVNMALWTEGLDLPEVSCIHQVRPTKSDALYMQMVGRGLRLFPGKDDCIAEGQRVLTDCGLVPIESVTREMKVWDGEEFVSHCGAVCRGYQEVITYAGLTATPDHKVWTDSGWKRFGECARDGTAIAITGDGGAALWEADGYRRNASLQGQNEEEGACLYALHDVWSGGALESWQRPKGVGRLPQVWPCRDTGAGAATGSPMAVPTCPGCAIPLHESEQQALSPLRGAWDRVQIQVSAGNGALDQRQSWFASGNADRPDRQRWSLRAWESALCHPGSEHGKQYQVEGERQVPCFQAEVSRCVLCGCHFAPVAFGGADLRADSRSFQPGLMQTQRRVWDILNAGPRHRFTVEGLLVSNCLILDYAPAEARNVTMMGDVLGVKVRKEVYIQDKVEEGEVVAGFTFDRNGLNWLQGNPMEIVSRQLDYMSATPWRWHHIDKGDWLTLGLGPGEDGTDRTLAISPPATEMHLWGVARGAEERWARAYHLSTGTFEEIQRIAEEYCLKWGNETLAFKAARWRKEAPTEGQLKFAKRLGLDVFGKTRGQLAADITHKLAIQALKRAGAA